MGCLIKNSSESKVLPLKYNQMKTEFLMLTHPGQTDLEQKSSADERESYIDTMSEETAIKQKTQ
jgi:hypothetical protein